MVSTSLDQFWFIVPLGCSFVSAIVFVVSAQFGIALERRQILLCAMLATSAFVSAVIAPYLVFSAFLAFQGLILSGVGLMKFFKQTRQEPFDQR
jgi:hypothetical protein